MLISQHFNLLMGSSSGFGSYAQHYRAINTWFPYGSGGNSLTCDVHKLVGSFFNRHAVTERINTSAPTHCKHRVSGLFHRPLGLLFTFPSRYLFTIGLTIYLALPVSAGGFLQAIRVLEYSRTVTKSCVIFNYRTITSFGVAFQQLHLTIQFVTFFVIKRYHCRTTPQSCDCGLGFSAFARRYSRNT